MFKNIENHNHIQRIKSLKLNLEPKNNYLKQRVRKMLIILFKKLIRVLLQ